MPDPHPLNSTPDPHPVATFDVDRVTLDDGRRASVLAYHPTGPQGLACDCHALRSALVGASVDVVVFCPVGSDRSALLHAAADCSATQPVLATAAPVTDAVKRVRGSLVEDTVDRASLSWAVGPAAVDAARLQEHLRQAKTSTVWPLTADGAGVVWL